MDELKIGSLPVKISQQSMYAKLFKVYLKYNQAAALNFKIEMKKEFFFYDLLHFRGCSFTNSQFSQGAIDRIHFFQLF